jgi:hypothetical protein
MTVSINGTSGLVFNDASTQATAATGFGFKNRIINGAMTIDQRNAGASVTSNSATNPYTLDRWRAVASTGSGQFSVQQNAGSVTPPAGFTNYLGVTSLATTSAGASDYFSIRQPIEGFNTADLGWGTANASTVTLSFWVRSSLTGTFGGAIQNQTANRSYPFSYTISVANTWEQKSITIAGDTSGTWATNSSGSINLFMGLGAGSSISGTAGSWSGSDFRSATGAASVVGTNGATFYITGVQLEKGSTATSFDYRPYGTELFLCQRYFYKFGNTAGAEIMPITAGCWGSSGRCSIYLGVPMRAAPTVSLSGTTAGSFFITNANDSAYINFAYTGAGSFQSGVNTSPYINYTADAASGIGSLYIQSNRVLSVNAEL